jgi:hypothetical protein
MAIRRNELIRVARIYLGPILGVLGLVFWFIAVNEANYSKMSAFGLVTILGWPYFVGLVLVVAGFGVELFQPSLRSRRLILLIVLLVLFLYGTAPAVEPVAALADSWIHAGFIQYILHHGHPLEGFDARFSWPGAFSLGAVLVAFTGQSNALGFLRWFPLFIELSYLAPLLVIARFAGVSRRARWLGVAIFYASNWIFQDYFSPQALNYLFFLTVMAAVFACWQPQRVIKEGHERGFWKDLVWRSRAVVTPSRLNGRDTTSRWGRSSTLAVLGLLVLIFLASSLSHQLTPYALMVALAAALVSRRLGRPELVLILLVLAIGWLSLGASNFWVGHLSAIFGQVGQLSSTVGSNVTSRISGSPSHLLIVEMRLLLTGALFALGGIGFLRRFADSRALEALVGGPFLLLGTQSYGGEGLLRVVLFGLPFVSLLAASAIYPKKSGEIVGLLTRLKLSRFAKGGRVATRSATVVVLLGLAVTTTVVRGGNDAYQSFSSGELAAVNYVYNHVVPGEEIGTPNYFLPMRQRDVSTVFTYSVGTPSSYRSVATALLRRGTAFIILSQSQEAYGNLVAGYPVGWETTVEHTLLHHGYRIAARWTTATVLEKKA